MRDPSDLAGMGVLIRQWDGCVDGPRQWEPCTAGWCAQFHAQWPSSIINAQVRYIYYADVGGFVFDSSRISVFCMYAGDGNSMDTSKLCHGGKSYGDGGESCVPGCKLPLYPGCAQMTWDCSFPPAHLKKALEAQLIKKTGHHNEVVIDTRSVEAHLPHVVTAFFYRAGQSASRTRQVRQAFLQEFGLSERTGPPLVKLSVQATSREGVFTLG